MYLEWPIQNATRESIRGAPERARRSRHVQLTEGFRRGGRHGPRRHAGAGARAGSSYRRTRELTANTSPHLARTTTRAAPSVPSSTASPLVGSAACRIRSSPRTSAQLAGTTRCEVPTLRPRRRSGATFTSGLMPATSLGAQRALPPQSRRSDRVRRARVRCFDLRRRGADSDLRQSRRQQHLRPFRHYHVDTHWRLIPGANNQVNNNCF